jgi:carotenoid cleavage dioxygenase-like enzyme
MDTLAPPVTAVRFPDKPVYRGFNKPRRIEATIYDLEVEGTIPPGIAGTFYRCGPDPQYPNRLGNDININGDGMVTAFRFEAGHADFTSRYVRTEKFELERAARKSLFGAYRNPFTDDPSVAGRDRTTANTNAVFHAGRLFALKEDGLPYELDPHTLETRGRYDYAGASKSQTWTAHPKLDPATGEMFSMGYEARGLATRDVALQRIDARGNLTSEEFFTAPFVSMMHDFAVTSEHIVFPMMSTTADLARIQAGGPHWMYDPNQDAYVGIMRRDRDVSDMRWFRAPSQGFFHFGNAFSDGDRVYVDAFVSERNIFPFIANIDGAPYDPKQGQVRLKRWMFDLSKLGDAFGVETLVDAFVEMPTFDDRYHMQPTRHAFFTMVDYDRPLNLAGSAGVGWNTIAHRDGTTGKLKRYHVGDKATTMEPRFVPRSATAAEGDGYILAVVTQFDGEAHTEVVILDTDDIEAGPVARLMLPMMIRGGGGIHGSWVPAAVRDAAL